MLSRLWRKYLLCIGWWLGGMPNHHPIHNTHLGDDWDFVWIFFVELVGYDLVEARDGCMYVAK